MGFSSRTLSGTFIARDRKGPPARARPRRLSRSLASALFAASFLVPAAALVGPALPAGAQVTTAIDFAGRGWGHGRGMGQYGALGYAVDHGWDHTRILGHYYSNTTMTQTGQPQMTVALTWPETSTMLVQQERGNLKVVAGGVEVTGPTPGTAKGVNVERVGTNLFQVQTGPGCGGPWSNAGGPVPGPISVQPTAESGNDHTTMLQVCGTIGVRWYRGTIEAVEHNSGRATVNRVALEDYIRGVVPRESPASWGDLGGGRGMEALKAQAVAARSYALAESRGAQYGAQTCDTTACQVYLGRAEEVNGRGFKHLEDPRTDTAVAQTAGNIRTLNGQPAGTPARTEFSSSTGGYTAGGVFPAVPDDGDDIAANPNHTWRSSLPASYFEAKWPGRGRLVDLRIKSRNGLGADGGRVTSVDIVFEGGTVSVGNAANPTVGGEQVRGALGLKSDWFVLVDRASFPYHVLTRSGAVYAFGGAAYHGGLSDVGVATDAIDITEGPGGYWILGVDGGVFSFNVAFHGSMGGRHLNSPVVGMSPTASANGYWEVAADGGIFSFGDAAFFGSTGNIALNKPVVGMAPTPSGRGYWLVASDGGIFAFGDAPFYGSTGNIRLNRPIVGMAPTADGGGYWLVASDGGLFAFGNAGFHGSLPGAGIGETAVEVVADPSGSGYLIATSAGQVYGFGSASSGGGPAKYNATSPTVAAARPR